MPLNTPITEWAGRRVWIVGASTGIGAALARALDARGARLALSARSADKLSTLVATMKDAMSLPLDVTDADALARAHEAIVDRFGAVDVAVLNAGTYAPMRAQDFDLAEMNHHFAVNYHGITHALATLIPAMRQSAKARTSPPPHIALVSSVAGFRGLPKALAYGPSKAALINLAETLYLDLSPEGIGISVINPGFVDTPLTAQNEFKMPGLISADEAAQHIITGFAQGGFENHFPKGFTRMMKAMRLLPYRLYFPAIRKSTGL